MLAEEQDRIVDEARIVLACEESCGENPLPQPTRYLVRVKRLEDGRLLVRFLVRRLRLLPRVSLPCSTIGRRVLGGAFIASQRGIGLVIIENKDKL